MRGASSGYVLKEYGSWSVLVVSFVTGLSVSGGFSWPAIPLFAALALLINSKQAFTRWKRGKDDNKSLIVFLGQIAVAAGILLLVYGRNVPLLLPLLIFPAAYLLSNKLGGEHSLLTEILGFTLISLAAVLAKFLIVAGIDVRLFVAVSLYFIAGVFKVKALLLKKIHYRVSMVLYLLFAIYAYRQFHISEIILLPLLDNLIAAVVLYKLKLKTIGWIEVAKSLLFLLLMILFF